MIVYNPRIREWVLIVDSLVVDTNIDPHYLLRKWGAKHAIR